MRRLLIAAPLVLIAAACTTGTGDFKGQTEDFLNDSSEVEELFQGADVSGASCEEPASTDVGAEYVCTAEVEGLGTVTFDGLINADNEFVVEPRPL